MTTVYLMRHSYVDKEKCSKCDDLLKQNMSIPLSSYGISVAKLFFDNPIFNNIYRVYCSSYVRSYETGKLLCDNVCIDSRLGERVSGDIDYSISPNQYFYKQFLDGNYKFNNGESRFIIQDRMYNSLIDIINSNVDKDVAIVSHGTAITFLLMMLCHVDIINISQKERRIVFNDKVIYEGKFDYLETFRLVFDGNNLIDISFIKKPRFYVQETGFSSL